jgi:nucleotide-binding universal stress UspA family protein
MTEDTAMKAIAVPIGNAQDAQRATKQAIELYRRTPVKIHLVNVQSPLPRHISRFFNRSHIQDFHRDSGMQILAPAIKMLDEAGIPHMEHVLVGRKVECIVRFAREYSCSQVILESRPEGLLSAFGLGSITSQIRRAIAGDIAKI